MAILSLGKNLFEKLQNRLPKEDQALQDLQNLALNPSPLYFLQMKLVFALNDLVELLSFKAASEIEIARALSKVNRLSRIVYLKKREIKRKQEEFEFFMAEKVKHDNNIYFNSKWDEPHSAKKNPLIYVIRVLKQKASEKVRYQFFTIHDLIENMFSFLKSFLPKGFTSSREEFPPKAESYSSNRKERSYPFTRSARFFGYAFAHMQNQYQDGRNPWPRRAPSPRPQYQPASHLRFGH
jgi:hypothetical protein